MGNSVVYKLRIPSDSETSKDTDLCYTHNYYAVQKLTEHYPGYELFKVKDDIDWKRCFQLLIDTDKIVHFNDHRKLLEVKAKLEASGIQAKYAD